MTITNPAVAIASKEGIAVDEIHSRIEKELRRVMDRLNQLGGVVVIEEFPDAVGSNSSSAELMEKIQAQGDREVSLTSRSLLVERANRLAEALERLREGQYGMCEECGEPILPARLRAMPEATTCIRCQDRLERTARQVAQADVAVLNAMRKRNRQRPQRRGV